MNSNGNDFFATTRWTMVANAAGGNASADAALEELCRIYWFPLYAYVRRRGHAKETAEDMTQEFFMRLLERRDFEDLNAEKGRFRAFLLASLKHFLANAQDRRDCRKRGGRAIHLSLDGEEADQRFEVRDPAVSPDEAFDREWALALLERVLTRLKLEQQAMGKDDLFESMKKFLTMGKGEANYRETAEELNLAEGTVRVMAHRMRKRYRALLKEEIGHTLADPAMTGEELAVLMQVFR